MSFGNRLKFVLSTLHDEKIVWAEELYRCRSPIVNIGLKTEAQRLRDIGVPLYSSMSQLLMIKLLRIQVGRYSASEVQNCTGFGLNTGNV